RVWHNMRASRQTELSQQFPPHVVCAWIGNTMAVAAKHYLQVTDADFERASHYASQQDAAPSRSISKIACTEPQDSAEKTRIAAACIAVRSDSVPPRGLESLPQTPGKTAISADGGAESGAFPSQTPAIDPGLAALIDAWPTLPEAI